MIVPFAGHAQPLAERVTGVTGVVAGWLGAVLMLGCRGTGVATTTGVEGAGFGAAGAGATGRGAVATEGAARPSKLIRWPG
ncbi:hypothetical protein BAY1663_03284 [Pseudomonas sp. BAY1663]|nr:hypothetical protein BAY1663_03284 [Pseudomonas sp. BAY1663]